MSRVKNSLRNLAASFAGEMITILFKFINRTVFIQFLGKQYLGITGLFTNVLSMLSLVELGLGSAITYNLYKPILDEDKKQIILLMNFYKKAYRVIGLLIGVLGIILLPFLPRIIKDDISFINVNFLFLMYLMETVSSYLFFAYKGTLIRAHQKEYIITVIGYFISIVRSIVQIIFIAVFRNFTLYVAILVISSIVRNLIVAAKADKMYPYIKRSTKDKLPKEEMKEIFRNCYALFIYKVNGVVLNATDNIVLSAYIGLETVGIYSNYLLIVSAIKNILNKFYSAITASIGNLHASGNVEQEHLVFKAVNFFTVCVYGLAAVGTFVVGNMFIKFWIGNEFVLPQSFTALIAMEIYIFGLQKNLATFRTSMGLFQQAKYRPLFGIIINLGVSLALINYVGIYAVVIGTIVAGLTTYMWYDPYIIYKHVFQKSVKEYFFKNIKFFCLVTAVAVISYSITSIIPGETIVNILVSSIICVIVMFLSIYLLYRNTPEYKYLINIIEKLFTKIRKRHS